MRVFHYILFMAGAFSVLLQACSPTKYLPEGKNLYNKATVNIATPENINHNKQVKRQLHDLAIPEPNKKFLGLFYIRLWLHEKVKEPKKEKGFRHWLKYKLGNEPVYSNESLYKQSTVRMEQYLQNNGYFTSSVSYEMQVKKQKVEVIYTARAQPQYFIHSIYLPEDSSEISRIIRDHKDDLEVKSGDAYSVERLRGERDKFATFIRSEGYYDFTKEYIFYYVDTTVGDYKLDVYFRVKEPSDSNVHTKYFIRDITVFPVYSIGDSTHPSEYDTIQRKAYTIIQPEVFLKPKTLVRNILIRPGEAFSQRNYDYTVNHFMDLGIFKFVNIKYEKTGGDSLDVVVQLTPSNTQDVSAELNVSTTTTNFLGIGTSVSYINRNLFRGAEKLTVTASVNGETQLNSQQSFINTLEINGLTELGFPRLLVPFGSRKVTNYFIPRTNFSVNESFQKRIEYYTVNSFKFEYAYDWRKSEEVRHIVTPFSVNDIRLLKTTPGFKDILDKNPTLRTAFEDVFIVGMKYSYIYTGKGISKNENYGYFRANLESAGNVMYLVAKSVRSGDKPYPLFGRPFANFSRFETDGRYYLILSKKHSYVNRMILGLTVPYGNSEVVPYLKQFYIGGASSVRAYRLRTLGPGSYSNPEAENQDVFPDQAGDIKLELNTEYRFTIIKFLKGALFADAGNVWLLKKDTLRPGGAFRFDRFYKEIAIGVGTGLRLDFKFIVIRADASFPIRKPELPEGDRWTFDKLQFGNKDWRQNNLIWNIAIGYPF